MKKILRLLLCCVLAFSMLFATACNQNVPDPDPTPDNPGTVNPPDDGDNKPSDDPEAYDPYVDWTTIDEWTPENIKSRPVTKSDILIGSYVSFCDTAQQKSAKAQLKILADGGLNFLPLANTLPSFGMIERGEKVRRDLQSPDWWKKIDEELIKRNMVYYYTSAPRVGFDNEACANVDVMTNPTAIAAARKIVPGLENCIGYHIVDEPSSGAFDSLAAVVKQYAAIKSDMDAWVNQLPGTAGSGYESLMRSWVDKCGASNVNILSHDSYPFGIGGTATGFQGMANDMRKVKLNNQNIKLGCFLQSSAWNGTRMPTADEIKWSFNSYLANGFTQFVYFNYAMYPQEECRDAIISQRGDMLHKDTYDALASYHYQIRAMGVNCRFTDLIARNVYYTGTSKPNATVSLPETSEYIARDGLTSGDGFIVSYLSNASESEQYLMIVNNSYTATYENKEFKVGAKAGSLAKMEAYNLETGKFESLWQSGESSFNLSFGKSDMKIIKLTNK